MCSLVHDSDRLYIYYSCLTVIIPYDSGDYSYKRKAWELMSPLLFVFIVHRQISYHHIMAISILLMVDL